MQIDGIFRATSTLHLFICKPTYVYEQTWPVTGQSLQVQRHILLLPARVSRYKAFQKSSLCALNLFKDKRSFTSEQLLSD